jgi:hypothetical protein
LFGVQQSALTKFESAANAALRRIFSSNLFSPAKRRKKAFRTYSPLQSH